MLEDVFPKHENTFVEIVASRIDIIDNAHINFISEKSLLSVILCNIAYKLKDYKSNESYSWLEENAAKEILKLVYKKDIIVAVIWSNKSMNNFCTKVFINEQCTTNVMNNMLSYFFKRVSDIKFRAEENRLNQVFLSKTQKELANKFSLQLKTMNWSPLKVSIDVNLENTHNFKHG